MGDVQNSFSQMFHLIKGDGKKSNVIPFGSYNDSKRFRGTPKGYIHLYLCPQNNDVDLQSFTWETMKKVGYALEQPLCWMGCCHYSARFNHAHVIITFDKYQMRKFARTNFDKLITDIVRDNLTKRLGFRHEENPRDALLPYDYKIIDTSTYKENDTFKVVKRFINGPFLHDEGILVRDEKGELCFIPSLEHPENNVVEENRSFWKDALY